MPPSLHLRIEQGASDPLERFHANVCRLRAELEQYRREMRLEAPKTEAALAPLLNDTVEHLEALERRAILVAYEAGKVAFRVKAPVSPT